MGNIEASNRESAVGILTGHNLFVLSLEPIVETKWYDHILSIFKSVKGTDMMIFTRQLATLIASQVPLSDSLNNLYRQTPSPIL
ncbi:hypothetical protein LCGC14_1755590, partial [marine sediment metagenome]